MSTASTCLVVGGNGFIGSHLVDALRAAGRTVRVYDAGAPRTDTDWSGVDFRRGAFADEAALGAALEGVGTVFHLVSTTVPSTSNQDPRADVQGNLLGSLGLMQAMMARGVRRIVFFSSGGTVYGNPRVLPVPEDHPLEPISSYGVVKVAIERYLLMYGRLGQLDPLILRPGNPYGPRQGAAGIQGVIPAFLRRVRDGEALPVWGDGSVVRDYIYIADLVELAVTAGLGGTDGILNAGSGVGLSLNALIAEIAAVTGRTPAVEYQMGRNYDVHELVLDIARAQRTAGWQPRTSLAEGLRHTWDALRAAAAA
jgi:UDP-glucose 4-epimerase